MLDELIDKARQDSLAEQADELQKTLDKLDKAQSKEEIKEAMESADLDDYAKEMTDKLGNEAILEQEKKELADIEDDRELEKKLRDSLLDE
ncbi:MAG: hypothetical protein H6765_10890 [Candidatus Peribacteria bacterium]|nr:MAG: hypothetical protein H6765_10890 [Candidatus Peribacteria bacterium]